MIKGRGPRGPGTPFVGKNTYGPKGKKIFGPHPNERPKEPENCPPGLDAVLPLASTCKLGSL